MSETRPTPDAGANPRVLVIGNYPPDGQFSMQRYAAELAGGVADCGVDAVLAQPTAMFGRLALGKPSLVKWLGYLDKYLVFGLRLLAMRGRFDIIHIADQGNALYRRWTGRKPTVVTCHDLHAIRGMLGQMADHRPRASGRVLQRMLLASLRQCPEVICVSQATADDVHDLIGPRRIEVIPNAVRADLVTMDRAEADARLAAAGLATGAPFFLHVGGNQFYKNRPGVVRVFDEIAGKPGFERHRLVLAGKRPDEALRAAIAGTAHRDRIETLTGAEDETIRALYSRAEALLFLSMAEGFGWPIVEAQACGCVVATSDREPMRGIGGPAAILIDPADEPGAASLIIEGLGKSVRRRQDGLENAEAYRPTHIFRRYKEFYARMLQS